MDVSLTFIRIIFLMLSILLSTIYYMSGVESGFLTVEALTGVAIGTLFATAIFAVDKFFKKFNLRSFNIAVLGMFFGYLLGQSTVLILSGVVDLEKISGGLLIKSFIYLSCVYIGMTMTARAAMELYISLPFFKFKSYSLKKKDILLDASVLEDPRFMDLAVSGLLDHQLIIPRYIINELNANSEKADEIIKSNAKRSLDIIKRLESLESLDLRYTDNDFPEIKEPLEKMVKLARALDANILTSDVGQIQQTIVEDVKLIKFQQLCNSLKPLSKTGENITIKIQRIGKEPRQGIGYLDDGTMVVVNGGAKFIEQSIQAQVLSVKRTSSDRMMIFCNAMEDPSDQETNDTAFALSTGYGITNEEDFLETVPNKYFTL